MRPLPLEDSSPPPLLGTSLAGGASPPRGISANNPGNIRGNNCAFWPRCVGKDADGYLRFRRPIDGMRAIVINLKAYRDKHHIRTLHGIASRWLKGDHTPEEIEKYALVLAGRVGVHHRSRLAMWDASTLKAITKAIVWAENSQDPYEVEYKTIFPRLK